MQQKKSSTTTYTVIAVVLVVGAAIYFYMQGGSVPDGVTSLEVAEYTEATIAGSKVLGLLNQIRGLEIDKSIFDSPAYQTLRDYTVEIPEVNVGRINPFAPISGSSHISGGEDL